MSFCGSGTMFTTEAARTTSEASLGKSSASPTRTSQGSRARRAARATIFGERAMASTRTFPGTELNKPSDEARTRPSDIRSDDAETEATARISLSAAPGTGPCPRRGTVGAEQPANEARRYWAPTRRSGRLSNYKNHNPPVHGSGQGPGPGPESAATQSYHPAKAILAKRALSKKG